MDDVAYRSALRYWTLNWRTIGAFALVVGLAIASVAFRLSWDRFLDPFEDGYQNWWTASALLETGTYSDRFSQMTRGNWLPGYTFFATGLIALFGTHIMPLIKAANILFSLGTTGIIYLLARPRGRLTAGLAAILFVLNPADIVISSFATPEALSLLATFCGVLFVERRPFASKLSLTFAALAFLAASTLRYEVWGFVGVYVLLSWHGKRIRGRELVHLIAPATVFAAAWWIWTSQYGFLPSMIINQTSTDVRFKASAGTLAPLAERLASFFSWYLWWTPFAVLALAWAAMQVRKSAFTWILGIFYGLEILYTTAGFGNPGPRYIHLTIPIVCIYAAVALVALGTWLSRARIPKRMTWRWSPVVAAIAVSLLLSVQVSNPSPTPGFFLSGTQRAGEFLANLSLPEGKLLISESPIAAYYSGFPASRILGSSNLPLDAANASAFLVENVAYVVMVTVPYNRIRMLFPDQANGVNSNHFVLLFDATGEEYNYGAPRVLVFKIVP